jgi:uncharacterized RDD family membrane protein YckC
LDYQEGRILMPNGPRSGRASFRRRLAAIWIDVMIVYFTCSLAFYLLVKGGVYFPFELTGILAGVTYFVIATAWKGRTIGKSLCGIRVEANDGRRAGLLRALVRETAGKLLSSVLLFAGYLWVAWTRGRRAWHDYVAGTIVTQDQSRRARWIAIGSVSTLVAALLLYAGQLAWLSWIYLSMEPGSSYSLRYAGRNPAELLEVAAAPQSEPLQLAEWLGKNGREPLEYAVSKAKEHRVVIFGEMHNQRQTLEFLNQDEQMTEFIERVMKARGNGPAGFDVDGSPFARLRDSGAWQFCLNDRLGLADIAAGYIYLVVADEIKPCTWMKGYVTEEMFTRNKPFYQSFGIHFKRRVASARDAEELLATLE